MPRGKPPAGITIGFVGTGEMEADAAIDLIEEFINESIKPDEPAKFVFPLTSAEFNDTLGQLADMAQKSKITYEVITNPEDKKKRAYTQIAQGAANQYLVTDVFTQMETVLVEAPNAVLMVLWDEKRDDELQGITAKFLDAEIRVLDLTNALAELGVEAEGEEGAPDEADEADEAEEEEEAQDVRELEAEAVATDLYTRAALTKMSHSEVKDIAVGMGLAPRKARENMIVAILEAQGTAEEAPVAAVRSQAAAATPVPVEESGAAAGFLDDLRDILDTFGSRFMGGLDDWLTKFSTAAEGFAFNTEPEEPMDVEPEPEEMAPKRPRLVRTPR
jgi:hypothetical protein